jgi:hypothetical protein
VSGAGAADRRMPGVSLHLRLAVGPVVLIDCELFRVDVPDSEEPPPQLNGGQGQVVSAEPIDGPEAFGFTGKRR